MTMPSLRDPSRSPSPPRSSLRQPKISVQPSSPPSLSLPASSSTSPPSQGKKRERLSSTTTSASTSPSKFHRKSSSTSSDTSSLGILTTSPSPPSSPSFWEGLSSWPESVLTSASLPNENVNTNTNVNKNTNANVNAEDIPTMTSPPPLPPPKEPAAVPEPPRIIRNHRHPKKKFFPLPPRPLPPPSTSASTPTSPLAPAQSLSKFRNGKNERIPGFVYDEEVKFPENWWLKRSLSPEGGREGETERDKRIRKIMHEMGDVVPWNMRPVRRGDGEGAGGGKGEEGDIRIGSGSGRKRTRAEMRALKARGGIDGGEDDSPSGKLRMKLDGKRDELVTSIESDENQSAEDGNGREKKRKRYTKNYGKVDVKEELRKVYSDPSDEDKNGDGDEDGDEVGVNPFVAGLLSLGKGGGRM